MKAIRSIAILILIAAAFAGGYVYRAVQAGRAASAGKKERKILYWVDPMHPAYKSDKPGIAPDCNMKLEPVYADGGPAEPAPAQAESSAASPVPPGTVKISPEKQQLIGVQFGEAEIGSAGRTLRAVGRVLIDEPRIGRVRTRLEGWVDRVFVDYVGQRVERGAPLMTLNSPEVLAAEREMLLVANAGGAMKGTALPEGFDPGGALLEAARRRLELWGLSQGEINQVIRTGEPVKTVTLYAPVAGYVTDLKATPGSKVNSEVDLFTIVDASHVLVQADVFSGDIPQIRVGQRARVNLLSLPGKPFNSEVQYIEPQTDAASSTYKVRVDMGDPGLSLRPDMYAEVEFSLGQQTRLTVPADAVIDSGKRRVVYLDRGDGMFEQREVQTGARDNGRVEIVSGLKAGQRVVTSGAFLIDSESQLRAPGGGGNR